MKNLSSTKALAPWLKIAATGGILLGAAAIVGSGAFAVWTSSATAKSSIDSGSIDVSMSNGSINLEGMAPGDTVQQLLTISFPQTAATGNQVTGIKFSVTPGAETLGTNPSAVGADGYDDNTGGSLFTGSAASRTEGGVTYPDGSVSTPVLAGTSALTYKIETCAVAWTPADGGYTCPTDSTKLTAGGVDTPLKSIATSGNGVLTLNPGNFTKDATAFVATGDPGAVALYSMISVTLPSTANNSLEKASIGLTFRASAVQRAGITTTPTVTPVS